MVTAPSSSTPIDAPENDLGPLAWVFDELRKSLDAAHKALKRFSHEVAEARGSDLSAIDPTPLRLARSQLHQVVGALEMVDFQAPASVVRAMENAVQRFLSRPLSCNDEAVGKLERAGFALVEYLEAVLHGKSVSPVALFPQYRDVQELAAAARIHPADLWPGPGPLSLTLPPDWAISPLVPGPDVRARFDRYVLHVVKNLHPIAANHLRAAALGLAAGAPGRNLATFWAVAAAYFEAIQHGVLPADVYVKRAASRVLLQYTAQAQGKTDVSPVLLQDLLFFVARAARPARADTPALDLVRAALGDASLTPIDYESATLGRFDPALLAQARRRVASAKEGWSLLAGGDTDKLRQVGDQFSLVADSLHKVLPDAGALALGLVHAIDNVRQSGGTPAAELGMEVATAILFLEALLQDLEVDDPLLPSRLTQMGERVEQACAGRSSPPLEAWMEDLYRKVSDRQTMGSVVGELKVSLTELERELDQFVREPADKAPLMRVPQRLHQMRGVLSVLGLDHAVSAVAHMRTTVEDMLADEVDADRAREAGTFSRLANNLSALSFLIDMLHYQPTLARKLFVYDATTGQLNPVMGRTIPAPAPTAPPPSPVTAPEPAPPATVAAPETVTVDRVEADALTPLDLPDFQPTQPADALSTQVDEVLQAVSDPGLSVDLSELTVKLDVLADQAALADHAPLAAAARQAASAVASNAEAGAQALAQLAELASPPEPPPVPTAPTHDEDDVVEDDLRDIFLEEARDVLQAGQAALAALQDAPDSMGDQTTLRRAFHTLKGSSRMVGLTEFGEAAWAMEQVMNAWLASARPVSPELCELGTEALQRLAAWVEDIATHRDDAWSAQPFQRASEAMRNDGVRLHLDPAAEQDLPVMVELADTDEDLADTVPIDGPSDVEPEVAPEPLPDSPVELPAVEGDDTMLSIDLDALLNLGAEEAEPTVPEPAPTVLDLEPAAPATDALIDTLVFDVPELEIEPLADTDAASLLVPDEATEPTEALLDLDVGTDVASDATPAAAPPVSETPAFDNEFHLDFDVPEPVADIPPEPEPILDEGPVAVDDDTKVIGPLRLGVKLFNVFLNEADEWSRRLSHDLGEWLLEHEVHPVPEGSSKLAHSLAGASGAIGFDTLSALSRALEHALDTLGAHAMAGHLASADDARLCVEAADDIRRLLHQFAAGFLKDPAPHLLAALEQLIHRPLPEETEPPEEEALLDGLSLPAEASPASPVAVAPLPLAAVALAGHEAASPELPVPSVDDDIDATDTLDADLFQIFDEEAQDLIPRLGTALRQWVARPENGSARVEVLRNLHTLKGSARLAGALRLGEMAHRMETQAERLGSDVSDGALIEPLLTSLDGLTARLDALRLPGDVAVPHRVTTLPEQAAQAPEPAETLIEPTAATPEPTAEGTPTAATQMPVDASLTAARLPVPVHAAATAAAVRVRPELLDRLVNQTGEVMITRSRMEAELGQLRGSLTDLTDNLDRLRHQLRDVELQAESQMQSRLAQAKEADHAFDPLEFDRFTRVQELTRMMAESVNDVATVQRNLQKAVDATEDGLAAQARQTRELQRDLLRTRMVEFEGIADRLYRVVRQASKETGKQVRLDIVGGRIEMDRAVLDRMTPAFEHLLRNCVVHGIEPAEQREAAGKPAEGHITVTLEQEGNDVSVSFADDGRGLDLAAVRAKAESLGLLAAGDEPTAAELSQLIFAPGLTTADALTGLAGRGIGMDVVRSEVVGLGGRIETITQTGQGTRFRMVLPLTTAVTQVVMLRAGDFTLGVPAGLVEVVRRVSGAELAAAQSAHSLSVAGETVPFYWAGALLQTSRRSGTSTAKTHPVVIFRSASQRVALHVDEVLGNQEVVVKNLGPQLSRLPGLAATTVLASGAVALIYNPVALSAVYGEQVRAWLAQTTDDTPADTAPTARPDTGGLVPREAAARAQAPLVMVVDDSITVRRVTQRLLVREGFRVVLAADGLQALEKLQAERPTVVLSDIEMPRMDGFDLVRNIRSDPALADLPVIMITSRIAEKHREHARQLGVDHYLGKPYSEDELLHWVQQYCREAVQAGVTAPS